MVGALVGFALLRASTSLGIVIPVSAACVVAYSGFFVAANRGMLQRMRPALRAGYSAMWLSITSVAMGSSSVLVGVVVQHGGPHAYGGLCLAYSALMAAAVLRYATQRGESIGLATELRAQFDAGRPILSVVRLCRYVLNPPAAE